MAAICWLHCQPCILLCTRCSAGFTVSVPCFHHENVCLHCLAVVHAQPLHLLRWMFVTVSLLCFHHKCVYNDSLTVSAVRSPRIEGPQQTVTPKGGVIAGAFFETRKVPAPPRADSVAANAEARSASPLLYGISVRSLTVGSLLCTRACAVFAWSQ